MSGSPDEVEMAVNDESREETAKRIVEAIQEISGRRCKFTFGYLKEICRALKETRDDAGGILDAYRRQFAILGTCDWRTAPHGFFKPRFFARAYRNRHLPHVMSTEEMSMEEGL